MASARSLAGLDWLNFSVANAQTGFGAFIAVYLTAEAWTQAEIGEALSLGTIAARVAQIPGGSAVDRLGDKRVAAAVADEAAAAIGMKPLMSGVKTEDEGLFVVQHKYWQEAMQRALAAEAGKTQG
jgi:hypothetical protein